VSFRVSFPSRALSGLFRLWQIAFSTVLPPSCRFTPSCSAYGIEAVRLHGAIGGGWLAAKRICRCHPWGGHGFDPVPKSCSPNPSQPHG